VPKESLDVAENIAAPVEAEGRDFSQQIARITYGVLLLSKKLARGSDGCFRRRPKGRKNPASNHLGASQPCGSLIKLSF
jgi:hypothetical protein